MKTIKTSIHVLYVLAVFFLLSLIAYVSFYLYASTIDAHHYAFNETWYGNSVINFKNLNGRWAQGFTNDHRFYVYRIPTTILLNVFFFGSIVYFFTGLLKKWGWVLASLFYFSYLLNSFNFYQITYLLNTSLSYTLGEGLLFVFYGLVLRKGFPIRLSNRNTWVLLIITIFLTGLVEHLFFLHIGVLGFLLIYTWLGDKKSYKGNVLYLLVAIAGATVTIFSPGLRKRRIATALRNERLGRDSSIDVQALFDTIQKHIELNLNWVTLWVFIFALILFFNKNNFRIRLPRLKPLQSALFLITVVITPVVPILLGYVGSNGLVGMPKAYNLFSFLVLLSCIFLAFFIADITHKLIPIKTKTFSRTTVVLSIGLFIGIVFSFFFDKKNALYFQQRQVFSGDIQKPYIDELARRQYLMETYHQQEEKIIPTLSSSYKGKVNGAHRTFLPRYYKKRFNSYIPITSSDKLVTPRSFTTIFLVINKKLKPVYKKEGLTIYYNATLQVLLFASEKKIEDDARLKKIRVEVTGTHLLINKKEMLEIESMKILKKYPEFFNKYSNYLPVELPLFTQKIYLPDFTLLIDTEQQELKDKLFFNPDYGNIMR